MSRVLSEHFTFDELIRTSHREYLEQQSNPPPEVIVAARRLAIDVMEPIRAICGPWLVTSWWRCPELNEALGGAPDSAHQFGRAIDGAAADMDMLDAFVRIQRSAVPFDKLIWEYGRWIHVQAPRKGRTPRRTVWMKFSDTDYEPFNEEVAAQRRKDLTP